MSGGGTVVNNDLSLSKYDPGDPLYLHPSDSNSLTIIGIKLKGSENYIVWANAMKLALQVKNKMGFIDKTCRKPTDDDSKSAQWERCNSIVLTWILNSISEELYVGQVFSKLASDVWDDLKETYEKTDGAVVFNLFQRINSLKQNGLSVSEYYHKLNSMWKHFDAMVQLPSCTCDASKEFNNFSHLIKLMQFLMGLDDVYQPVRTTLLTRDPLPTVKAAFAIISREESHKNSVTKGQSHNFGFSAKPNSTSDNKKKPFRGPNPNLKCTHCNKVGHTIDRCFELVGYPPNFKGKGSLGRSPYKQGAANSSSTDIPPTTASSAPSLTAGQISKLLSLLNDKPADATHSSRFGGFSHAEEPGDW